MRKIARRSIEELIDLIEEIQEKDESERETYGELSKQVKLQEEFYRRVSHDRDNEYRPSLERIKKDLIVMLVHFGSFLKTRYEKDPQTAEDSLKRALNLEKALPIAYYRLGFLAYKRKDYFEAAQYFHHAIHFQETPYYREFKMMNNSITSAIYIYVTVLYIWPRKRKRM